MAGRLGAVHVKLLGTAQIAKSVKWRWASIVRAHQNLRGDHSEALVLVYHAYVRNCDGDWAVGDLSVVELSRPGHQH